jgi:hypothetical protein
MNKLELELNYKFKDFTSIKIIDCEQFLTTNKNLKTRGIIILSVNENEYIADTLIHGDILKDFKREFSNYQITIKWI